MTAPLTLSLFLSSLFQLNGCGAAQSPSAPNSNLYFDYLYDVDTRVNIDIASLTAQLTTPEIMSLPQYIEKTLRAAQQIDRRMVNEWNIPVFCTEIDFSYRELSGNKRNWATNHPYPNGRATVTFFPVDPPNYPSFFAAPGYIYAHELGHLLSVRWDVPTTPTKKYLTTGVSPFLRQMDACFTDSIAESHLGGIGFYMEELFADKIAFQLAGFEEGKIMIQYRLNRILQEKREKTPAFYFYMLVLARAYDLPNLEQLAMQKIDAFPQMGTDKIPTDKITEIATQLWQTVSLVKQNQ